MKKLFFFAPALALLVFLMLPQVRSFEEMGKRRFAVLSGPEKEVGVGVCWPTATNKDGMVDGLQLAVDEINAKKQAGDYTLRLILRDNSAEKKTNTIAVEFADTPEMSAVIGYYDDRDAMRASPVLESSRLLHLIVGANNTAITSHAFEYVVRTTLSSDKIGKRLAQMTADSGYRKVVLIWEEDAYGEDLAYQYQVILNSLNIDVVYQWSYSREYVDFRLPVNELKGVDADVVFFAGLEPWAGDFLRAARGVGLTVPIIGAFSDTPEMRERGGAALEGSMYFEMYDVESKTAENQKFVREFSRRFGKNPDTWAAQGYDALHILAKAIQATGSRNPLDLSYAIRYMDAWEGANGRYKFGNDGNLENKPIFLMKYQHGIPVTIHPDVSR